MKISIVIPNYNGKNSLEKSLPRIIDSSKRINNKVCEVIIIDDCSTDDSLSFINKNYKEDVKIVKHTKTRGYYSTLNTGARSAKVDFICVLNPNVIPSEDFLESIHSFFDDKKVFAVSTHEKGVGSSKGRFTNGFIEVKMRKENKKSEQNFYVSAGSSVFRKSMWHELGGMDDKILIPCYWTDVDMTYRASKRGYYCYWNPDSHINKDRSELNQKLSYVISDRDREVSRLLIVWKNIQSRTLINKHIQGLFKKVIKEPKYILIIMLALTKISVLLKARKKEIKECTVSDEVVFQRYQ